MRSLKLSLLLAFLFGSQAALSDPIFYEVENVSGNTWQYTYTVGNDGANPIEWFTIWFDFDDYYLPDDAIANGPDGWDVIVVATEGLFTPEPDDDQPGFFDACGFYDLNLPCYGDDVAVAPGSLVGGFTVTFEWLGTGTPGSQPFTLFGDGLPDEPTLFTQQRLTSVPEPGTLALFGSALFGMGLLRRRRQAPVSNRVGR